LRSDDSICVVLEHAPGGDLFDYIVRHARLKGDEARRLFRQLVDAVSHCHENGVVHRDLKPENILMDAEFNIKIADFGLSSEWSAGEKLTESCGSPNYAAPELLSKGCSYEGPEVDVWSLGVVLYTLLCGCLPFDDDNIPSLFKKIKQGKYSIPGFLSPGSKDLITKILTVDPAARMTMQGIKEHYWFKDELEVRAVEATATPVEPPVVVEVSSAFTEAVAAGPPMAPFVVATPARCSGKSKSTSQLASSCAPTQSAWGRTTKSALQLLSSGDRSSCRQMRTGSTKGSTWRQYSA